MDAFAPQKQDLFTFGLWTVGNPGRDPFGEPVRPVQDPNHLVRKLAECGAYGVNLHDNDLLPFGCSAQERDRIVREFQRTLKDTGLVVPMATTNLFTHPAFKDGAFSSNDPKVRAFALQKTMAAIDLGVELGTKIYVFWGGREGTEADACRDPCRGSPSRRRRRCPKPTWSRSVPWLRSRATSEPRRCAATAARPVATPRRPAPVRRAMPMASVRRAS